MTLVLESKFVPLTVSVKAAPPTVADVGLMLVMAAAAACTVKLLAALVPVVVVTTMLAVPAEAIRFAGTEAVTWFALT